MALFVVWQSVNGMPLDCWQVATPNGSARLSGVRCASDRPRARPNLRQPLLKRSQERPNFWWTSLHSSPAHPYCRVTPRHGCTAPLKWHLRPWLTRSWVRGWRPRLRQQCAMPPSLPLPIAPTAPTPLCDIPSGCFFTGPWTVTRSSLRMLCRVAAFCWPLWPLLLLVLLPRSQSPVVGVLGLCWMWHAVPFARQRRPVVGIVRLCWLLWGSFDCFCCSSRSLDQQTHARSKVCTHPAPPPPRREQ